MVKRGIRFYHISNRPILSLLIVTGVSSWMLYTVMMIHSGNDSFKNRRKVSSTFVGVGLFLSVLLIKMLKLKFYQLIWFLFALLPMSQLSTSQMPRGVNYYNGLKIIIFSQLLVAVFFHREVLSLVILVFILYPKSDGLRSLVKIDSLCTLGEFQIIINMSKSINYPKINLNFNSTGAISPHADNFRH